ncbi:MAG TPA: S8 family serine peptidase [Bacteroidota bacterium]|nr:S8 family serine peptidase [Bacteroidota bacterium]
MRVYRCPICSQRVPALLHDFTSEGEAKVVAKLRIRHPYWSEREGLCERCLYLNEFDTFEEHFATMAHGTLFRRRVGNPFALLPTPLRLNTDPRFAGRGVTIAFIDSGFYPHPDLTRPQNRIRAIVDVTGERKPQRYFRTPHPESWHGMMTSVVAAGNGHLSDGLYRGIASEAEVVLIKVMDTRTGRINTENITRGLRWAIDHHEEHSIRIISISVADDEPVASDESPVDRAAEEAASKGIVVVAAIGNTPEKPVVPPASSPSVITVGGLDDRNEVWHEKRVMYHSTYGKTVDGHAKPEIIAPAIWVAGPILPGSDQHNESEALFKLLGSHTTIGVRQFETLSKDIPGIPIELRKGGCETWVAERIKEKSYIAPAYKNVDGTSFAAPIVSSVIAQMLEAMPDLSPNDIRRILMDTAQPVKDAPIEQQGSGVLNPRAAVHRALGQRAPSNVPGAYRTDSGIVFVYHNRVPRTVALAGDFNSWDVTKNHFDELENGVWSCWLPLPPASMYHYKFVIDRAVWIEDPSNPLKDPDGYGGWNSQLVV